MKKKLKTSIAFAKNILVTGAITETSRKVEIEICKQLPKEEGKIIVEFGIGHGNITQEILNTISLSSKLYAFEVNKKFCDYVREHISDDRLIIINDGAENINQYLNKDIDGVVSSIPFSFFSKEKSNNIIKSTHKLMRQNTFFSQVLLTKFNFKKFHEVFEKYHVVSLKGGVTEHVIHCEKLNKAN
ncbi:class I SAM-dependent methyltransferase [Pontimicrobium aquaticum]|uniref:Uncharacterized protein n=1 Tax=Pontimicrobium aquaticum TaxID=2565367 RepID=A0A4U0F0Z4_9FLAO|nr:methyltransferase domain-containing protein [Pontimicrobium aquaticum]TJY37910.1 hypothetical protein E5167_01250 [Pontimicrobium aquaticum]